MLQWISFNFILHVHSFAGSLDLLVRHRHAEEDANELRRNQKWMWWKWKNEHEKLFTAVFNSERLILLLQSWKSLAVRRWNVFSEISNFSEKHFKLYKQLQAHRNIFAENIAFLAALESRKNIFLISNLALEPSIGFLAPCRAKYFIVFVRYFISDIVRRVCHTQPRV